METKFPSLTKHLKHRHTNKIPRHNKEASKKFNIINFFSIITFSGKKSYKRITCYMFKIMHVYDYAKIDRKIERKLNNFSFLDKI